MVPEPAALLPDRVAGPRPVYAKDKAMARQQAALQFLRHTGEDWAMG